MENSNLKKAFNRKLKIFLLNFIKESTLISKYILKLLLVYIVQFIKKIMPYYFIKKIIPYRIKLKIQAYLLVHPKISKLLRRIRFWAKNIKKPKETFFSKYILPCFIKKIGLPILQLMLTNKPWREITLDKSKKIPHLYLKFKGLLKDEIYIISQHNNIVSYSFAEENIELTNSAKEIYIDLKSTITRYKINY